jgi:hypothetical protein
LSKPQIQAETVKTATKKMALMTFMTLWMERATRITLWTMIAEAAIHFKPDSDSAP